MTLSKINAIKAQAMIQSVLTSFKLEELQYTSSQMTMPSASYITQTPAHSPVLTDSNTSNFSISTTHEQHENPPEIYV